MRSNMATLKRLWIRYDEIVSAESFWIVDELDELLTREQKLLLRRSYRLNKVGFVGHVQNAWGIMTEDQRVTLALTHPDVLKIVEDAQ